MLSITLALALALALIPAVSLPASAASPDTTGVQAAIMDFSDANGEGLTVNLNDNTVTVTGAITNVTSQLELTDISANVTIHWHANLTSTNVDFSLITLSTASGGSVAFNVNQVTNISHSTNDSLSLAAILIDEDRVLG